MVKKATHRETECHESPEDIARLPPVGRCKAYQSKRDTWKIQNTPVRQVVPCRWSKWLNPEAATGLFAEALDDVPV